MSERPGSQHDKDDEQDSRERPQDNSPGELGGGHRHIDHHLIVLARCHAAHVHLMRHLHTVTAHLRCLIVLNRTWHLHLMVGHLHCMLTVAHSGDGHVVIRYLHTVIVVACTGRLHLHVMLMLHTSRAASSIALRLHVHHVLTADNVINRHALLSLCFVRLHGLFCRNQCHTTLRTFAWLSLLHFRMHRAVIHCGLTGLSRLWCFYWNQYHTALWAGAGQSLLYLGMHRAGIYLSRLACTMSMRSLFTGHFRTLDQGHATLWAASWPRLAHFGMHGTRPLASRCLLLLSRLLFRRLVPGHMHGESAGAGQMHIAFHGPHHLAARVHHHHHHEEHHHKHPTHIHHDLDSRQQVSTEQNEQPGQRDKTGHQC